MTTTKLGSAGPASKLPTVARSTTPVSTSAVSKSAPLHGEAAPGFDAKGAAKPQALNPKGEHVPTSADPGALWGAERRQGHGSPELRAAMTEFRAMSPEAQKAKIGELKTRQDELSKKMLARIETLDARYKNMRNVTKAEMLRELSAQTEVMTPAERGHLDVLLDKADGIARQIEELKAKASTLPDSKTATPAQLEERKTLARQIKNARSRLSDATKACTNYVDSLGLKNERLAVNEQKIDPGAPPKDSPSSLWGMMKEWFSINTFIGAFQRIFSPPTASDIVKADVLQSEQRVVEDQKVQQRAQEFRRRNDDESQKRADIETSDRRAQLAVLAQALSTTRAPALRTD